MKKLLIIVLLLAGFQMVSAHPFCLSLCDLHYKNGTLTFSTRLLYSDFCDDFRKTATAKKKNFVRNGFDKTDIADLTTYFNNHLTISVNNKAVRFKTYEYKIEPHETDAHIFTALLTTKIKIREGDKIKIFDNVLLETVSCQQQIINVWLKGDNAPSHDIITLDKNTLTAEFVN